MGLEWRQGVRELGAAGAWASRAHKLWLVHSTNCEASPDAADACGSVGMTQA
jgi:hypothetical protein